jgi:REP element-mobilizing transposase RayT
MQRLPQRLESLLSKARATALILLRAGRTVHAVGNLSDTAIDTLSDALQRYWPRTSQQEFNRTVSLRLDGRFHLVFAKSLSPGGDLIGLVFPIQTPLIRIRQDMTDILRALIESQHEDISGYPPLEQSLQFEVKPSPQPDWVDPQMGWRPEGERPIVQDEEITVSEETDKTSNEDHVEESELHKRVLTFGAPMKRSPDQADVFENPEAAVEDAPWQLIDERCLDQQGAQTDEMDVKKGQIPNAFSTVDDVAENGGDLVNLLQEGSQPEEGVGAVEGRIPTASDFVFEKEEGSEKILGVNHSVMSAQNDEEQLDEQISDITFYLVPRLGQHHLVGELSRHLRSWMQLICAKYGWEMILLSVRPDYIKWTLGDFPESLIQEMLRLIRIETSKKIFRFFPDLREDTQGGDYWAPGYLVDLQNREFTTQALMAHVASTRLNNDKEY